MMDAITTAKMITTFLLAIALFISAIKKKNATLSVAILVMGIAALLVLNSI